MKPDTDFDWAPDWSDRPCVIVASGPSARVDLGAIRGKARVVTVNSSVRLCPWADALYAADVAWWRANGPLWRGFDGLKIGRQASVKGVCPDARAFPAGSSRNSGHQAIDVARMFGARRVCLVGFDLSDEGGTHWHGDHKRNPKPGNLAAWARHLDAAAYPDVVVVRETALRAYPVLEWKEAVEWLS